MAWSAPMTASSGAAFTAAQFNQYVRDNFNETAPGKATTISRWFVASAANTLAERQINESYIATSQSTSTTTYTDLTTTGPSVTATTGTKAIVSIYCNMYRADANIAGWMSFAVSGATSISASDAWSIAFDGSTGGSSDPCRAGSSTLVTLTAGSNTFTSKYRATSGTTATFIDRRLSVWSF